MRFYDITQNPPQAHLAEELLPKREPWEQATTLLKMGMLPSTTTVLDVIRSPYVERYKMHQAIKRYQECQNIFVSLQEEKSNPSSIYGTKVHEALEDYLLNRKRREFPEWETILPLLDWIDDNVKNVLASETTYFNRELGCAGTTDALLELKDGTRIIADLKVVKFNPKFPIKPSLAYRCQLSVYAKMLEEKFGKLERQSFYLPSPFGADTKPRLIRFFHQDDYLPQYHACKSIWDAQYAKDQILSSQVHSPKTQNQEGYDLF